MTTPETPITDDMSIPEIVTRYPRTEAVFRRLGIDPTYKALAHESLKASALVNQIDTNTLLTALNEEVSQP
ncbi:MAG: hypothetical protein IPK79_04935 [Vampirovibrionales bacterium]|nr:hypothetical protein [Vampirovibrionales bacterium]